MNYAWYLVFNTDEFDALDLVSKLYTLDLEEIGEKEILVTKGNFYSILYEDVLLPLQINDENPFAFEDFAIYINADNDVYLGILIES